MKYVAPSIHETAFNCPHCGALAKQFWYTLRADEASDDQPLPMIIWEGDGKDWGFSELENNELKQTLLKWVENMKAGSPFFESGKDGKYTFENLNNVWVSRCFNCNDLAIWIHDRLIFPQRGEAPQANPDIPADIRRDYDEASAILDRSPRGAAALIRLGIQKLCRELGETGENINADIASLVSKGLDPRVQKALDAVRVIGNNAVHPGQIDLRDDRATAESLFRLMNLIVEKTISEPKHVDELYDTLPDSARAAIEKRDGTP
jgi:hypothetical protein